MTISEKINACTPLKDAGNSLFKQGNFNGALENYTKATALVSTGTFGASDEESKQVAALNITLHCNLAQVYLNLKEFKKAMEAAKKVVDSFEPGNPKALYRLSQALAGMGKFQEAVETLESGREVFQIGFVQRF